MKKELENDVVTSTPAKIQNDSGKQAVKPKSESGDIFAISCSWNPYGGGATAVTVK